MSQGIEQAIQKAITTRVSEVLDAEIKRVTADVERKVRAEVGAIAATVLSRFSYERMGNELIIRVHFDNFNNQ